MLLVALLCLGPLGCRVPLSFDGLAERLWSPQPDELHDQLAGLTWVPDAAPPLDVVDRDRLVSRWRTSLTRGAATSGGAQTAEWPPLSVESSSPTSPRVARTFATRSPEELSRYLSEDGLAGWNGAVVLGRRGPRFASRRVLAVLRRLVVDPPRLDPTTGRASESGWGVPFDKQPEVTDSSPLPPSLRLAAAEAWVWCLGSSAEDPVDALAPVGRLLEERTLPPSLRAELTRGVTRWIPPSQVPHLTAAVGEEAREHASVALRRAAVEACVVHAAWNAAAVRRPDANVRWPRHLEESEADPDPVVRATYGTWVATAGTDDAWEVLLKQLQDRSRQVRHSAILALGQLAVGDADDELVLRIRDRLETLAAEGEVRVRTDAVHALGRLGVRAVEPFVDDDSGRVREVAAQSLADWPTPLAARHLLDLSADRSLQVESAAVSSVASWPDELAVPVLLRAMESGGTPTRLAADRALRRRLGVDYSFNEQDALPERRVELSKIVARFGLPTTPPPDTTAGANPIESWREQELLADLSRLRDPEQRPAALARLREIEPAAVSVLERRLVDEPGEVRELVVREVFPSASPVYAALQDLEGVDRRARVAAARRLAATAQRTPLSPFAVARLRAIVVRGVADRDVWRAVLESVGPDGGEEAARLVQFGLGFRWPDVQRLACEYVERHPRPAYAAWLTPLFEDEHRSVRIAAIRAAVACRNPVVVDGVREDGLFGTTGLRSLLRDEDVGIRTEAAVALALLGEAEGLREVDRLARGPEPALRVEAIRAMSRSGHRGFTGTLIAVAHDDRVARVRREALDALRSIVPELEQPREASLQHAPEIASRAWVRWWAARRSPGGAGELLDISHEAR